MPDFVIQYISLTSAVFHPSMFWTTVDMCRRSNGTVYLGLATNWMILSPMGPVMRVFVLSFGYDDVSVS